MILIFVGIRFLIKETAKLDIVVTKTTAIHITKVVDRLTVTARPQQIPSPSNAIGLLLKTGSRRTSF